MSMLVQKKMMMKIPRMKRMNEELVEENKQETEEKEQKNLDLTQMMMNSLVSISLLQPITTLILIMTVLALRMNPLKRKENQIKFILICIQINPMMKSGKNWQMREK